MKTVMSFKPSKRDAFSFNDLSVGYVYTILDAKLMPDYVGCCCAKMYSTHGSILFVFDPPPDKVCVIVDDRVMQYGFTFSESNKSAEILIK